MSLIQAIKNLYLTFTEQSSAPANPDSGDQRLYFRTSDHHLVRVNSSGTVTDIESGAGAITRSGATTDAHLAVWNGSSADSLKDGGVPASGGASTADPFVIGPGAAADLSAAIRVSSLAGSPDRDPGGVNDDEFDTTNGSGATNWTSFGTPDVIDENTVVKSHLHLKANAAAGDSHKGVYKAHGAGTAFTVVAKITAGAVTGVGPRFGLYLSHGAPGKFAGVAAEIDSSNAYNIYASMIWTNPTSFGSNPTNASFALGSSNIEVATGVPTKPLWLRLVVTDSSHVQSSMSHNGYFWINIGSSWDTSLGAGNTDYVVLAVDSNSASVACEMIFDYVRFS